MVKGLKLLELVILRNKTYHKDWVMKLRIILKKRIKM